MPTCMLEKESSMVEKKRNVNRPTKSHSDWVDW